MRKIYSFILIIALVLNVPIIGAAFEEEDTFYVGKTWTVDGQWEVTVEDIRETDYRNPESEYSPAAVYYIDYIYKNLGYTNFNGEDLYLGIYNGILDAKGFLGYVYPGQDKRYPEDTPKGCSCRAVACIGVDHPGDFQFLLSMLGNDGHIHTGRFYANLNRAYTLEWDPDSSIPIPSNALCIGDILAIDDKTEFKYTKIEKIEDEMPSTAKNSVTTYQLTYEYKNISDETININRHNEFETKIIDSKGYMGNAHPEYENLIKSDQNLQPGKTTKGSFNVTVDHDGSIQIIQPFQTLDGDQISTTFFLEIS